MPDATTTLPLIFVSHSHLDNAFCRAFVAQLRRELRLTSPDDIFYDESSFHVSDAWLEKMQREVVARPIFVIILSPHSVVADYVKMEVNLALTETIPHPQTRHIIGVLVEACDVNLLAPALRLYQMADIPRKGYEVAFDEVLATLRATLTPAGPATPASAAPQTSPTPPATTPPLAQRLGLEAQEALALGHWNDARLKATYALTQPDVDGSPLADALREALAQAALATRQWQAARDSLLAISPSAQQRAAYWRWLAHAQRELNQADAALAALDNARIFTPTGDSATRRALLAERRAILTEQHRWDDALATLADEQALAPADPNDPSALDLARAQRDLLAQASRPADALPIANRLTTRPDATADDWLTLARLTRAAHPSPPDASDADVRAQITRALDAAAGKTRADTPGRDSIAQARRTLLPMPSPPAPPIPTDRFPPRLAGLGFPPRLASLGFNPRKLNGVEVITPPLCAIPAGPFLMGSDKRRDSQADSDEQPQHTVTLAAYKIARYPVTVAEYDCAVRAGAVREPPKGQYTLLTWQDQLKRLDHPAVGVSWNDAIAYVGWLAQTTGQPWRLPTEAEWEKAARGTDGRIYPWGDAWDKARANTREGGPGQTTPVGTYPGGASPYDAQDMAGNVWEWTNTRYQAYP